MGIYSKDRTMLTIDPTAKSRPIPGYTSASDLYKIMEGDSSSFTASKTKKRVRSSSNRGTQKG